MAALPARPVGALWPLRGQPQRPRAHAGRRRGVRGARRDRRGRRGRREAARRGDRAALTPPRRQRPGDGRGRRAAARASRAARCTPAAVGGRQRRGRPARLRVPRARPRPSAHQRLRRDLRPDRDVPALRRLPRRGAPGPRSARVRDAPVRRGAVRRGARRRARLPRVHRRGPQRQGRPHPDHGAPLRRCRGEGRGRRPAGAQVRQALAGGREAARQATRDRRGDRQARPAQRGSGEVLDRRRPARRPLHAGERHRVRPEPRPDHGDEQPARGRPRRARLLVSLPRGALRGVH
ncbi:hypothetical protein C8D89_107222 [Actinomycetospora cinnamomea]|uniref:Uncharacterized protein n=1 Tax=Actinomycetospora cinnamomea TaxID=663609 RepID=A0A2U1FA57_9PSEU|nr:hypothetical protein C8D89_107222 [Actinomycetospora cinnamomea]